MDDTSAPPGGGPLVHGNCMVEVMAVKVKSGKKFLEVKVMESHILTD
jgi:hypothetical protein